jgi:TRAP-type C4-dicarboxylate transport system permease small subunit
MVVKKIKIKKSNKRILKWLFYIILYTFFIGILYGTVDYYFDSTYIGLGMYMSWEMFFLTLGGFGWIIISLIVLKGKRFGE